MLSLCSCGAGEINTLRGNVNWMKSRQGVMKCEPLGLSTERTLQKVGGLAGNGLAGWLGLAGWRWHEW